MLKHFNLCAAAAERTKKSIAYFTINNDKRAQSVC